MISEHKRLEFSCKKTTVHPAKQDKKFHFRLLRKLQYKELRLDLKYRISKKTGNEKKLFFVSRIRFQFYEFHEGDKRGVGSSSVLATNQKANLRKIQTLSKALVG